MPVEPSPAVAGRPAATSRAAVHRAAMLLFAEHGYERTTVEAIAAAAGTSRRTFFRYFDTKSSVPWFGFDRHVERLARELAAMPSSMSMMTSVRQAVLALGHDLAGSPQFREHARLVTRYPEVAAGGAADLEAFATTVAAFAGRRTGVPAGSLLPLTVGRATLAACRTAVERWVAQPDADLTQYLDIAVRALITGFGGTTIVPEPGLPR